MAIVGVLFVSGIVLLFAEFFVPGAVLGTFGGLLLISSCVYGWYAFPEMGFVIVVVELLASALSIIIGMYLFSNTRAGRIMVLDTQQLTEEGWSSPSEDPKILGAIGDVISALRPAGSVRVDGKRIDAVSSGSFIDKGKAVRVIEVEGHRVVVEEAEALSPASDPSES